MVRRPPGSGEVKAADAERLRSLLAPRRSVLVRLPGREEVGSEWPAWVDPSLRSSLAATGIARPWQHQAESAELAHGGTSVVIATGTSSGKSLGYLLPALSAILAAQGPQSERATTLYLAPTKALAADQRHTVEKLALPGVRVGTFDGDTPDDERDWVRRYADYVLTNPDMLHRGILPVHRRWRSFLRAMRFLVVDECHHYRGVFGSHVALVLRRLLRLAHHYGAEPTIVMASATASDPQSTAQRLVGRPVVGVVEDASPRGPLTVLLVEPTTEDSAPGLVTVAGTALADMVGHGARSLAFVRSRRAAETVAARARDLLAGAGAASRYGPDAVAAYRGGYLPQERRELESALRAGILRGVATTNALELGVDLSGLDSVLVVGWPGTRASFWQQVGRAGRDQSPALAVLLASDDPLDAFLTRHPDAVLGTPVEQTVLDPGNPVLLGPHLCAAAAELALTPEDALVAGAAPVLAELGGRRLLRRRPDGWYWTGHGRVVDTIDLRGSGTSPVRLVEHGTGRLLGTVDAANAGATVHAGAVYVHQGATYLVDELDLDELVATVHTARPDYFTVTRRSSSVALPATGDRAARPGVELALGPVSVREQVVAYQRRALGTGEVLAEVPLDLPEHCLTTTGVFYTVADETLVGAGLARHRWAGSAHAAEHAAIGLLPLVATCDRWDVGGVSSDAHPDTGRLTVCVHDAYPGGAGFAARGHAAAREWLGVTRETVADCPCEAGCPACVQSPKCGSGNEPLDKAGAILLLDAVLPALFA